MGFGIHTRCPLRSRLLFMKCLTNESLFICFIVFSLPDVLTITVPLTHLEWDLNLRRNQFLTSLNEVSLLSKQHCCYKIHTLLMKSSAQPPLPTSIDNLPYMYYHPHHPPTHPPIPFLQENLDLILLWHDMSD